MSKGLKRFFATGLSEAIFREITDALVIFSISILTYMWIAKWGGLTIFRNALRPDIETPSPLLFCGVALVVFSMRRIGDQRRERGKRVAAEKTAYLASTRDLLTQLPNRRQFQIEVSTALKKSNKTMSVLLLGLNHFKELNEVYGHLGCDEALSQIGSRIRDSTNPDDLFARIGDDEFALCLAGTDPENALRVAGGLLEGVKEPVQIGIEHHSISASIGIVQVGRGHTTVDELLRCAHVALSRARSGQVDCCFFYPKMDAHVRARALLEKVSFESLARWRHPINDLIAPETFIPLAEELGLMDVLSGQLFGDSCRDAANWPEDVSLSFNFSATQLSGKNFAQNVLTILADNGLPPYRLEAEITESAVVSDFEATRHAIRTLRNAGVRIVIDDFGTGYSGLSQLYELRFDKLKVDKRFIQEIGKSSESDIFMRAIFGLCKGLDLCVTAEGIETVAQADAAFAYGAHQGQGFLFSEAVPADRVPQLLIGFPQANSLREKKAAR